jgi:hypothetical protein
MTRKFVLFLMVGVLFGALTGLALADFTGEVPQSSSADDQMSAEIGFTAVGGVADYWPEDSINNMAQERGPVETGALPETSYDNGNDVPSAEPDGALHPTGTDSP